MQNDTEFTPANTIYLNNLPYGGGPSDFQEIQAAIKQSLTKEDCELVDDIKVRDRRDRPDSYSVYALARFKSPEVVAKLIKQGTLTISGKPIKVESYAGEREYHIYIKSTHSLTPEQIRKHFSQFGQIEGDHNYTSEDHNSCLLRFVKQQDAEKCLQNHQHIIEGTRLWLERYISKEQRHEQYHRLFLNKIPVKADNRAEIENLISVTYNAIQEEMSKFGKLVRKVQVEFKETQPKFGHSIVYFSTPAQAEEARLKFNRNLLSAYGSEPLELDNFISRKDRDNKGQLYASDILASTDQSTIRELFEKYGKVDAVNLNKYSHQQKGVACLRGTITFEDRNSINEVLSEAHKDKLLCNIFLDENPKVNIYMSKQQRQQFSKTMRKPRQQQPPAMNLPFPAHPMMMQQNFFGMAPFQMMPQMGAPMNPGLMPTTMPSFMPPMPMPMQRRQ